MSFDDSRTIRIAILDLYEGHENQGMRCIREILNTYADANNLDFETDEYDVRRYSKTPNLSYDIYISSGGPGSPIESENAEWENAYFNWLNSIEIYNKNEENGIKKHVFFICHSFQLICRHYKIATVTARKSTSFGVFPIHMMPDAFTEPVFEGLRNPFYAVDSRDYQVIEPNLNLIEQMGGSILCIEKERPHIALERAIMAMRFNPYFFGTQFHPEADAEGMSMYLQRTDKKEGVIKNHGEKKWKSMIEQLDDPLKIMYTHNHVLPNFLNIALEGIMEMS